MKQCNFGSICRWASSRQFLLAQKKAQKITEYCDTAPLNGAEFTLSVTKNVAPFETVRILRKIRTLQVAIVLPLSNGVTGDRSTETSDRLFG